MRKIPEKLVNFINAKAFSFVLVLIGIVCSASFGQSITWQRTFNGPANYNDRAYSLTPADGNNFYAVGRTIVSGYYHYILKLNEFGDTLWTRSIQINPGFGDFSLSSVTDGTGGVVVTGDNDTSFTMKLDKNGNIIWYKNYNTIAAKCYSIIKKIDGGYISCGFKLSSDYYGYVLSIDSSGNLLWQREYPSTELRIYHDLIENFDGFYLTGSVTDAIVDTNHVLLTKIDIFGEVQWEKRYTIFGKDGNGKKIARLKDKIIIAGTTTDSILNQARGYIMELDTIGNVARTIVFPSNRSESLQDMLILNESRLLLILTRDSTFNISTTRVIITDLSGNIVNEKHFIPPQNEGDIHLVSGMKTSNGDLLFAGNSYIDTNATSEDVFVARTDSMLYVPPIAIINSNSQIPKTFEISEPFPNPFNPGTKIVYKLNKNTNISINIYDINGRFVKALVNGFKKSGTYILNLELDENKYSSGIYFISFASNNNYIVTKRLIYIK